jgi:tRNA uridine 5-carbamoylmethylation protein Kti12
MVINMIKVVILGGNARSGKTTLAYLLQKKGFNRISFDLLNTYIDEGLKIKFDDLQEETKFNYFETVVDEAVKESQNENIDIVIDMYDYLPHDIDRLKNKSKLEVYFLAYPNCSKEEIKYNIVHYAKPTDWISQVDEDYLEECVTRFFDRNRILVEECTKYNMTLIDTKSGEERNIIIKELYDRIIKL